MTNSVLLEGNLVKDAVTTEYPQIGRKCTRWVLAIERINPENGRKVGTDFVPCQLWYGIEESLQEEKGLRKGARVELEGPLRIQYLKEEEKQYVHVSVRQLLVKRTKTRIAQETEVVYDYC